MAKQKNGYKTSKLTLIVSAVFILVCIALLCSFAYAWFTITDKPQVDGSKLGVTTIKHNGYEFVAMDGKDLPSDGLLIYPGDKFAFTARSLQQNNAFGIRADVTQSSTFDQFIQGRDDLLVGQYQIKDSLIGSGGTTVERYRDFDIDEYLISKGCTDSQRQTIKEAFLKKFTNTNAITLAITMKVTRFASWSNLEIPLVKTDYGLHASTYYLADVTGIERDVIFEFDFYYGEEDVYPVVSYDFGFGDGVQEFRSLSYNCFITHSINLSFLNER